MRNNYILPSIGCVHKNGNFAFRRIDAIRSSSFPYRDLEGVCSYCSLVDSLLMTDIG